MKNWIYILSLFALLALTFPAIAAETQSSHPQQYVEDLKKILTEAGYGWYEKGILTALEKGDFEKLDEYFSTLQIVYENGKIDDVLLLFAYSPFTYSFSAFSKQTAPDGYDALFKAWAQQKPTSYAAHFAYANYLILKGWDDRGHEFRDDVSNGGLKKFSEAMKAVYQESVDSLNLVKKPTLNFMLQLESLKGAGLGHEKTLVYAKDIENKAKAIDPENLMVRKLYMSLLRPRWFGSNEMMAAYAEQTRKEGLSKSKADFIEGMVYFDIAQTLYEHKEYEEAATYSKKAADLQTAYFDYDFGQDALKLYIKSLHYIAKQSGALSSPGLLPALDILLKEGRNVKDAEWYYKKREKIRAESK